jgi:hypothetical protein
MDNIIAQLEKKPHQLKRAPRVVDVIGVGLAVAGQVNDGTGDMPPEEKTVNGDEVGLHAAVRRRIGSEKQYSHNESLEVVAKKGTVPLPRCENPIVSCKAEGDSPLFCNSL